jgi:hypothetical protein
MDLRHRTILSVWAQTAAGPGHARIYGVFTGRVEGRALAHSFRVHTFPHRNIHPVLTGPSSRDYPAQPH